MNLFIEKRQKKERAHSPMFGLWSIIVAILVVFGAVNSNAQDPRERLYNYQVLNPNHAPKPKVNGWAEQRVSENINRGLVAFKVDDGVYLSWRLLATDPENVAFDVYEEKEGQQARKMNEELLVTTPDFMIKSYE